MQDHPRMDRCGSPPGSHRGQCYKDGYSAIDVAEFFSEMLKKYRIPPKYLNIDIAKSAYLETHGALSDTEAQLQQMGFRVILDGFDGDYVELSALGGFGTDLLKLDLRSAALQNKTDVLPVFLHRPARSG